MIDFFTSFILDWCSQRDWSATGSMLGGIGTCVAVFFAWRIAKRQNELTKQISEKQFEQTKLGQKIALYDKRYEVYELFSKYIYIGNIFLNKRKDIPDEINKMIVEQIYFSNEEDREYLTNEFVNLAKILNDPQKQAVVQMTEIQGTYSKIVSEYNKSKSKIEHIHKKIENMDYTFAENQIAKIRMSEFCYPKEIAQLVIKYISLVFSQEAYQKHKLNEKEILSVFTEIQEKSIVSKMKSLLTLSYEEVQN